MTALLPADPSASWLPVVLVFAGLILVSFLFSGTETAFFSLQDMERRRIAEGTSPTHRAVHGLLSRRRGLITTILIGNEATNVTIAALAAAVVAVLAPDSPWLVVVCVTPALVLLSEVTPKVIAFRYNRRWVELVAWPLWALFVVLAPLRWVVGGLVGALARLFGVTEALGERPLQEDEFLVLVERGAEQGVVGSDEREIIEAVFELDDLPVSRLMTPTREIFSLPVDVGWDELLTACQASRFSRVPIWEGSPDALLGVLLVKDLLRHRRRPLRGPDELRRLLLAPVFVPASKPANEMMRDMIRRRIHMAFVVDEHGTLVGLVSLDDLIVELVGEIADEYSEEEERDYTVDGDESMLVRASVDLEDFAEETGVAVPEGEYHTLGGYVAHTLGRIPATGDHVELDGHRLEVTETDGRRVVQLRLVPLDDGVAS
ncbi:MAG: HlyC/CorC family transporter [Alphaproteobacteria bacterium]|nr:HlyC/CorC family transporter [Alphaproteobacteria bacterium]